MSFLYSVIIWNVVMLSLIIVAKICSENIFNLSTIDDKICLFFITIFSYFFVYMSTLNSSQAHKHLKALLDLTWSEDYKSVCCILEE
jgi:hypothetical protein